jgi:hypothetical protein
MNPDEGTNLNSKKSLPTGNITSTVFDSAVSSWNGKVDGFEDVVKAVGGVFDLFEIDERGEIVNLESLSRQIMQGIVSTSNSDYKAVVEKLSGYVERSARAEYEELAQEGDSASQSALLSNKINEVLRDYKLLPYAEELFPDIRTVTTEKLQKDEVKPKPAAAPIAQPVQQQEEEEEKEKKEDTKSKKEKEEVEEGKDPNEKLGRKKNNEFENDAERDIREGKKKEGEAEQSEESSGKNQHDPNDIKNRNQIKQKNNESSSEAQQGDNLEQPSKDSVRQEKPSEASSESPTDQPNQGQGDGKSSTSTKDRTPEKNQGQNQSNSSQPNKPSQSNTGNEIPRQGNQPPGNSTPKGTTPGNTGTPNPKIPSSSTPTSGNFAPGKGGIDGGGGIKRLSSDPLSGAKPSISPKEPLKLPKIKTLDPGKFNKISGQGSINKSLGNGLNKVGQQGTKLATNSAKVATNTAKAGAKAGVEAAKVGAKLASQAAQAGLRLAASAIQAIAAFLAPLAPVIAIIALIIALILGILFIIVAFACPGINTFAQKSSEIVGADKLAFNDKLDDRCKPANKNPCGPGSGNVGGGAPICLSKQLEGKSDNDTVTLWKAQGGVSPQQASVKNIREIINAGQQAGVSSEAIAFVISVCTSESAGSCATPGIWESDNGLGCYGVGQVCSGDFGTYSYEDWTKNALGRIPSPQEYKNSPALQMKTMEYGFNLKKAIGAYPDKPFIYGAAARWLGGEGCDQNGTCSANYGEAALRNFNIVTCQGDNNPLNNSKIAITKTIDKIAQFTFNPFGSVEVRAQSSKYDWIADGGSFDGLSLKQNGRFTRADTGSGGIDITIAEPGKPYEQSRNTPVVSHLPGTITFVTTGQDNAKSGYGNQVGVYYPSTNTTAVFSHLETVNVTAGQSVSPGSLMGRQGSTGSTRGGDDGTGKGFVHIDLRLFEGRIDADSGGSIDGLDNRYNTFVNSWLDYYAANSAKIIASNFSPTATLASNTSSVPCTPESSSSTTGVGSATLLEEARRRATGKPALGKCYDSEVGVASYINNVGFAGIKPGEFLTQPMVGDQGCAKGFAEHYNYNNGEFAKKQGIVNLLDANPNLSPYNAPAGSIVVVSPDSPGTRHLTCGDITVAGGGGEFFNDGEMGYGGPEAWDGSKARGRSGRVLGIYVPATGVNALPSKTI